ILLFADYRPLFRELGIQFRELLLTGGNLLLGENGFDGALGFAQRAVDALIRIDHEEIGPLMETIHGADFHAVHVLAFDTAFGDHERHELPFYWTIERELGQLNLTAILP